MEIVHSKKHDVETEASTANTRKWILFFSGNEKNIFTTYVKKEGACSEAHLCDKTSKGFDSEYFRKLLEVW